MPQSLSLLLVHIIFSTKDRKAWLNDTIRPELHAYMASVAGAGENFCFRVGGVEDHVHIAVLLARNATVAKLVEALKVSSSKWIKTKGSEFASFGWQRGYAAFSVALSIAKRCWNTSTHKPPTIANATTRPRCEPCSQNMAWRSTNGSCGTRGGASAPITRAYSPQIHHPTPTWGFAPGSYNAAF